METKVFIDADRAEELLELLVQMRDEIQNLIDHVQESIVKIERVGKNGDHEEGQ